MAARINASTTRAGSVSGVVTSADIRDRTVPNEKSLTSWITYSADPASKSSDVSTSPGSVASTGASTGTIGCTTVTSVSFVFGPVEIVTRKRKTNEQATALFLVESPIRGMGRTMAARDTRKAKNARTDMGTPPGWGRVPACSHWRRAIASDSLGKRKPPPIRPRHGELPQPSIRLLYSAGNPTQAGPEKITCRGKSVRPARRRASREYLGGKGGGYFCSRVCTAPGYELRPPMTSLRPSRMPSPPCKGYIITQR